MSTFSTQVNAQPMKVEIIEQDGKYALYRDGKPYIVNGVGFVGKDLARVSQFGANSIRTWSVDDNDMPAQELLDKAHALGLTVSLALEFAKERYGFDFNDNEAVAKIIAESRERVLKYKDHPALLTWIVGNEVNMDYVNPKVFDAINKVAMMIKEVDPYHPTTTALAGFDKKALADIEERAPDLDFVSFQMYADLVNLPKYIEEVGYSKPYFITEWGAVGHWEVYNTSWGAPVENTSTEKAQSYLRSFNKVLKPYADQAIGNYVFLWGQKQEKTPTWYGMFLPSGEATEPVDVMYQIWNGEKRPNGTPRVGRIAINEKGAFDDIMLDAGERFKVAMSIKEPDNDSVQVEWEIRLETTSKAVGGDFEYLPQRINIDIKTETPGKAMITAPKTPGAYRLFAYVYDNNGNAGHANIPFLVK
jgi:hypothetical protein